MLGENSVILYNYIDMNQLVFNKFILASEVVILNFEVQLFYNALKTNNRPLSFTRKRKANSFIWYTVHKFQQFRYLFVVFVGIWERCCYIYVTITDCKCNANSTEKITDTVKTAFSIIACIQNTNVLRSSSTTV